MDEAFIYLVKVNIALVVFYLFYRLLFSQDTFFVIRRFCLWTILGVFIYLSFGCIFIRRRTKDGYSASGCSIRTQFTSRSKRVPGRTSSISGRLGYSKVLLLGYRNTFTRSDCYSIGFNRSASL